MSRDRSSEADRIEMSKSPEAKHASRMIIGHLR